jgi:hypothetical protein
MNPAPSNPSSICPDCGAPLKPHRARCWLCQGNPFAVAADGAGACRPADARAGFQYSLASLLLVVTLVAIICSIIGLHPGVGIVVAFLAVPALGRTCITAMRRRAHGRPLSPGGKIGIFLLTLVMVVSAIAVAGGAFVFTFLATCLVGAGVGAASRSGPDLLRLAISLGAVVGVLAGLFYALALWMLSHHKRGP